jgi:hypothetical protein
MRFLAQRTRLESQQAMDGRKKSMMGSGDWRGQCDAATAALGGEAEGWDMVAHGDDVDKCC